MSKQHLPKLTVCQNCETPTPGNFCPECGQDSRDHRVALRLLVVGLWNDLFTFDNRFWRSLVLLLFKPGALTKRFVAGRRVRYIPPARMYLFISLVFFFLMSSLIKGEMREGDVVFNTGGDLSVAQTDSIRSAVADSLGKALADVPGVAGNGFLGGLEDGLRNDAEDDGRVNGQMFGYDFDMDEETLVSAVVNLLPKAMFLLLPLFALLLKLVYVRSGRPYVEHLIFSLHFHSFVFILLTIALVSTWFPAWLAALALHYVYLYLGMKRVYGQGWRKTWVKHFLLTNAYNLVFMIFVSLVVVSSVHLAGWAEQYPKWLGWLA